MALEGTFRDFHIADIIQLIGLHQKTGLLTLETAEEALQVFLRDGEVVGVRAERPPLEAKVAAPLVARGILSPAKLEEALAQQRDSPKPLGTLLAAANAVPHGDWSKALAAELETRLYRPFRWTDGKYRFVAQDAVDPGEGAVSPIRVDSLLMEGMRRADEWPQVLQDVPSPKLVFKVGGRQGKANPREIAPTDVAMLKLVDGKRTVEELVALSGLGEFEAYSGLANLVRANAVTAVGPVLPESADAAAARPRLRPPIRRTAAAVQAAPPAWIPRAAWAGAVVWLLAVLAVGGLDPLGLFPVSAAQRAALNRVRVLRATEQMQEAARRVELVGVLTGIAPASLDVLSTVAPMGQSPVQDPWGQPYRLVAEGGRLSIVSSGADERPGTADDLVR
jgi:hypothetical protein